MVKNLSEAKVIGLLLTIVLSMYLSSGILMFVTEQFVYYKYSTEAGIPYGPDQETVVYPNGTEPEVIKEKRRWVQQQSSYVVSVVSLVSVSVGTVTSFIAGYISDRYGRSIALGLIFLGQAIHMSSDALIMFFDGGAWLFLIGSFAEGIFGGGLIPIINQISVCTADLTKVTIADLQSMPAEAAEDFRVRRERKRLLLLGLYDGLASLFLAAGSALGGTILYHCGFIISGVVFLVFFVPTVISLWFLPETRPDYSENSPSGAVQTGQERSAELLAPVEEIEPADQSGSKLRQRLIEVVSLLRNLDKASLSTLGIFFIIATTVMWDSPYVVIYLLGNPFLWNAQTIGLWLGLSGVISAVLTILLITLTVLLLKLSERKAAVTTHNRPEDESIILANLDGSGESQGCLASICGTSTRKGGRSEAQILRVTLCLTLATVSVLGSKIVMAIAGTLPQKPANALVYLALLLNIFKCVFIPLLRSILSTRTVASMQGRLFAIVAFLELVGLLISVSAMPAIFAATVHTFSGTVFVLGALLLVISLVLCLFLFYFFAREPPAWSLRAMLAS